MAIRVAVVGAGIAGLSCAHTLSLAGCEVEIYEAEATIGGRIATMRLGPGVFDHGTPYVVPRLPRFSQYLHSIAEKGYAARWQPRGSADDGVESLGVPWYVGTPGMSALVRPLLEGSRIHLKRAVHTIKRTNKSWFVWFEDKMSAGPYAAIVLAVPAPQAILLLGGLEDFENTLSRVRMAPCWSLQVHLDKPVMGDRDVHGERSEVVRWIARNTSKPRRPAGVECLVVHASHVWSRTTEQEEPTTVANEMWEEMRKLLNLPASLQPIAMQAHLWKHGFAERPLGETYVYSSEHRVGIAGDWCRGRLVDHAFESGVGLGKALVASM